MSERKLDPLDREYYCLAGRLVEATDEEKSRIMGLMERIKRLKMAQLNEEQKVDEIDRKKSEWLLNEETRVAELERARADRDLCEQLKQIEIEQKKAELERTRIEVKAKEAELEHKHIPWEAIIKGGTMLLLAGIGLTAEANGHILPKFAGIFALNKMVN